MGNILFGGNKIFRLWKMENVILANGIGLPAVGFGSYKVSEGQDGTRVVKDALLAGYRLIDTAAMYKNEEQVGKAIKESVIPRNEILLTSKVANTDRGYDSTLRAFDESLRRLGTDYLDLYLIHWPADKAREKDWRNVNAETWRALERLLKEGRARAIGVSNFMKEHLVALSETADILPMVNQIEFHPGWMQREVYNWCVGYGIVIEGWSPLGRTRVLNDPLLIRIAERYSKSVAQICLRWAVQLGVIPLPKSVNPERMKSNIDIFDFTLSEEDMKLIESMPATGESGLSPDNITF